jgi:hypothetical protein
MDGCARDDDGERMMIWKRRRRDAGARTKRVFFRSRCALPVLLFLYVPDPGERARD